MTIPADYKNDPETYMMIANVLQDMGEEVTTDSIIEVLESELPYDHYGLPIYVIDGAEWAIAETYSSAEEACEQAIKESAWAFNAEFIASYTRLTAEQFATARGDTCEDFNDAAIALVGDNWSDFVQDAIGADGIGHFLGIMDGVAREIGNDVYAFRVN